MQTMKQKIWLWAPVLMWLVVIFLFSHQPKVNLAPAQPSAFLTQSNWGMPMLMFIDWDTLAGKAAHLIVFGLLAFLLWRINRDWRFVLGFVLVFALADETHQLFIEGRTGRLLDVVIDMLGAIFILWALERWLPHYFFYSYTSKTVGSGEKGKTLKV